MPCDWPTIPCGDCPEADPIIAQAAEDAAIEFLWRWTGRQFGLCETTVRPCRKDCAGVSGLPVPYRSDGVWFNMGCGSCVGGCSCGKTSEVLLRGPVADIVEVVVDGVALLEDEYRVDDYQWLVHQNGEWPRCQNLGSPDGDPGTWSVTYMRGREVPAGGQLAAGVLACELLKAACNDDSCGLPKRVQTVTRQGITIGFIDQFTDILEGRTGLWEVDSWVASVRHEPRSAKVFSPDVPAPRVTTWPTGS